MFRRNIKIKKHWVYLHENLLMNGASLISKFRMMLVIGLIFYR